MNTDHEVNGPRQFTTRGGILADECGLGKVTPFLLSPPHTYTHLHIQTPDFFMAALPP